MSGAADEEPAEFVYRDGRRLRLAPSGQYYGVTKRIGKGPKKETSYIARVSITKRKGDARRQYYVGTFGCDVEAAIAIADALDKEDGPLSPEGGRKARTCAPLTLSTACLDLFVL